MRKKTLFMMSALALGQYAMLRRWASPRRGARADGGSATPGPSALQTWETEGGGLPLTGAQLSPDIPVRPQTTLGQDG